MENNTNNQPLPPQEKEQLHSVSPKTSYHPSKIFIILMVVFLVITVGVGGYILGTKQNKIAQNQSQPAIPTPQPSPTPVDETANWKTFRSDNHGFEIKYPPSLGVVKENDARYATYVHFSKNKPFGSIGFNIDFHPYYSLGTARSQEIISLLQSPTIDTSIVMEHTLEGTVEIKNFCDKKVLRKASLYCGREGGCSFYVNYHFLGKENNPSIYTFGSDDLFHHLDDLLHQYGKSVGLEDKIYNFDRTKEKVDEEVKAVARDILQYIKASENFDKIGSDSSEQLFPMLNTMICKMKIEQ